MTPIDGYALGSGLLAGGAFVFGYGRFTRSYPFGRRRLAGSSSTRSTTLTKPDYSKIARLEIETFGRTQICDGSPVLPGFTNIYGITDDGHCPNGSCNVNVQLGPVCQSWKHSMRDLTKRKAPQRRNAVSAYGHGISQIMKAATGDTTIGPPPPSHDPYADWTDEDGRPW